MTPTQVLESARNLIANPEKWTTETFCRDAKGRITLLEPGSGASGRTNLSEDERPVCFCSMGAVHYSAANSVAAFAALGHLRNVLPAHYEGIADFNDGNDHEAVLNLFDKAIAYAKAKEASA